MRVYDIYSYLNSLFPTDTACDFDNVGILVGDKDALVERAIVSLDCTFETIKKAKETDSNLIITHHPVVFEPLKNVLSDSIVFELIKNDISVISMHTNLDIAKNGVSEELCKIIGLSDISSVTSSDGFVLKSGVISPVSANELAQQIKERLKGNVRYVDGEKAINKVLVCSGSGGEFVFDAVQNGFDALITSEVKHHQFLFSKDNGLSVFDAGHFCTEDIITEPLAKILSEQFNEIEFKTYHSDSIKYV